MTSRLLALYHQNKYYCGPNTEAGCRRKSSALEKVRVTEGSNVGKHFIQKPSKKDIQSEHYSMTYNDLIDATNSKDSTEHSASYNQLVCHEEHASPKQTEIPSDQKLKVLIVTRSEFTNNGRIRWAEESNEPYNNEGSEHTDDDYKGFKKARMPYDKDPIITNNEFKHDDDLLWTRESSEPLDVDMKIKKETEILENQYLAFVRFVLAPLNGRLNAPKKITGYKMKDRDIKTQYQLGSEEYNREYERDIELENEITYSSLKRQIAMANDKESKESHSLYKTLNRKFKRSNTEDFFRDPVAACVEVLEYISAWIAEMLSLPPPDPVDQDLLIYKRENKYNYSYMTAVIKNKKAQFLISRGRRAF